MGRHKSKKKKQKPQNNTSALARATAHAPLVLRHDEIKQVTASTAREPCRAALAGKKLRTAPAAVLAHIDFVARRAPD